MLHLFDERPLLFRSWRVLRFEQEGDSYLLHMSAILRDGSRLEIRDYLFADGRRSYAYQWMEVNDSLRRRWDNAPHWPDITTTPHHMHTPGQETPGASSVTNLEDLLQFVDTWMASGQTPEIGESL